EVEHAFLIVWLELYPQREVGRQRRCRDRRFEGIAVVRSSRFESKRRGDVVPICVGFGGTGGKTRDCKRLSHVVIEVHPENVRSHQGALEVVPAVVGHEELSAVTRVVVAVGTSLISGGSRIAILARSWLKLADARIVPAREIQRRCGGN